MSPSRRLRSRRSLRRLRPPAAPSAPQGLPVKQGRGSVLGLRWGEIGNYRSYIGEAGRPEFLTDRPILEQVGGRGRQQRDRYRQYVEAGLVERDEELEELLSRASLSVGSEQFQAEIEQKHQERVRRSGTREDAAFRRPGRRATVEQVRAVVAKVLGQEARAFQRQRKGGWERALLAKALVEQAGLTQREAAGVMGLSTGAAVSIQLRRLEEALPAATPLKKQVREIESQLLNLSLKG